MDVVEEKGLSRHLSRGPSEVLFRRSRDGAVNGTKGAWLGRSWPTLLVARPLDREDRAFPDRTAPAFFSVFSLVGSPGVVAWP